MTTAEADVHSPKTVWDASFDVDEQAALKAEDSEAWQGVTGLLLLVVCCGVLLASLTVLLICVI
jgi:hypothetical protein